MNRLIILFLFICNLSLASDCENIDRQLKSPDGLSTQTKQELNEVISQFNATQNVEPKNYCKLNIVAKLFYKGRYFKHDEEVSEKLFYFLAEKNYPEAQFNLALLGSRKSEQNPKEIINGVTTDSRIGKGDNNPSFGYGGYCFPKDTRQLLANFRKQRIPNKIIQSIVYANDNRKDWITNRILQKDGVSIVGIHRLVMKSGSDNYRSSAIQGIIQQLLNNNVKVIIYEPSLDKKEFMDCVVENNHKKFKKLSDLIVTNRIDDSLKDVIEKTYTRDIFNDN